MKSKIVKCSDELNRLIKTSVIDIIDNKVMLRTNNGNLLIDVQNGKLSKVLTNEFNIKRMLKIIWFVISVLSLIYVYYKYISILQILLHIFINIAIFGILTSIIEYYLIESLKTYEFNVEISNLELGEGVYNEFVTLELNRSDYDKVLKSYKNHENIVNQASNDIQQSNILLIQKYAELLNSGIITQEQFDKKKNELLDL